MNRRIVLDTGVLIRYAVRTDPQHESVRRLVIALVSDGDELCYTAQGVREAWNVLTRPIESRGFGRTFEQAERAIDALAEAFAFLPETPEVFDRWKNLIARYRTTGKSVHDANMVATALTHGAPYLAPLNERDFRRYAEIALVVP